MERLDPKATDRVSGPAWEPIRPQFNEINDALLQVSKDTKGDLTTIYIKYSGPSTQGRPYAVVWVKKSTELVVGFSLPETVVSPLLVSAPPKHKYAGLTKYLIIHPGDTLPSELATWVQEAYDTAKQQ
ncbi:MAG: hypothetical protein WCJ35_17510 [Planctomycetota bacterium]